MELKDNEQRQAMLAAIIDSSEDAIISKNLQSRITSWNKAAERMFGYTEDEMVGQLIHILIPEDRRTEEDIIIASLKAGKRIEHFETVRRTKTGKHLQISLTVSPIRDSTGKIVGASKIARDITRQKQNEERLHIINSIGKAISAQLDIDTILQLVTDATTRLSGAAFGAFFYNKVDSKGEAYMLYALSGAPREAFDKFGMPRNTAVFNHTFQGIGIVRSDDITKDPRYGRNAPHKGMPEGHLPVVSYLAVPVTSQSGVVIGGLFFGHPEAGSFQQEHEDLVAAIAAQAAIALDNAKLYNEINFLNSKKDQFISFASHELKTPLSTIKGYMQVAKATQMHIDGLYPKIDKQVTRLENIIGDLLDVSKIQAGKLNFTFEKISLFDLLRDSIDSVDMADHTVKLDLPAADLLIHADYQKMSQVLVNLLSNASKYSDPRTKITVSARVLGDQVQVSVTDEGVGIPEKELTQVFNQFYRIAANAKNAKGMGLGLYIAKEIMESHFGKIWVTSDVGKGSTFHIELPIERNKTMV